jgi:hypothetical protein
MVLPRSVVQRFAPSMFTLTLELYRNVCVKRRQAGSLNAGGERDVVRRIGRSLPWPDA